ncbi:MAG: NADH-quinone oxidoreductase subunit NuoH [Phycisphaeraceae bacterium]|nr:NADH-quinone oxidoreductase subunit NuoH [Phycisphaeraceae bacterium]
MPAQVLVNILVFTLVVHVVLITVAYLIYVERKVAAYIQDRIGPNRVGFDFGIPQLKFLRGFLGLGQPLADGLKFLLKEDYAPDRVDKWLFTLAPVAIIVPALIGFAIIPFGGTIVLPDFSILGIHFTGGEIVVAGLAADAGVIYLLGVASLGVYGVTLGGWASNNKYSFLGGLRCSAQMISYEIPLGLSLLAVLLLVGSLSPTDIIAHQREHGWLAFGQPIAAVIFFLAILAEANRAPFDNAEAEQELVGGYHTEYSSMRFALFFLAEYAHMITSSAFFALLFLGGWQPVPFLDALPESAAGLAGVGLAALKFGIYFGKVLTLVVLMMVIRWTIPRLRYDQVMIMAWQAIIPISLAVVVLTSIMVYFDQTTLLPMLLANGVLFVLIMSVRRLIPKTDTSRRIPLYGSRFNPMPGETVRTGPMGGIAREDRPIQGTAPTA